MQYYRAKRKKHEFVFGASDTVKSETLYFEGELRHLHLRVPNFTNAVTATVTIEDSDGYEIYNSTGQAKNTNYNLLTVATSELLTGQNTLKVTLSGVPGGTGGTVIIANRLFGVDGNS